MFDCVVAGDSPLPARYLVRNDWRFLLSTANNAQSTDPYPQNVIYDPTADAIVSVVDPCVSPCRRQFNLRTALTEIKCTHSHRVITVRTSIDADRATPVVLLRRRSQQEAQG
jgi:hypothetical protein